MSIDGYIELSHYSFIYLHFSPMDTMQHFNILLLVDVNIMNYGLFNFVKGKYLP
jgi:hypothetical protein